MNNSFAGSYSGKTVLVTGHTGFKGSWLSMWLTSLGARVIGYALEPPTQPNHFDLLKLDMVSCIGDVRDLDAVRAVIDEHRPEIVFHLAAQPLVRLSYDQPQLTLETNIMGTVNVLEACRTSGSVRAIVNVTSDKCYENREWVWGYRESDAMGGYDPYSASKGCSELVTQSYQRSFFNPTEYGKKSRILLASCRAGNVIGGGDWARDRLMTDIMLSVADGRKVVIRNPRATRPWQHVLEPLSGYLLIGEKLLAGDPRAASAWNFGPDDAASVDVETVVNRVKKYWDRIDYEIQSVAGQPHEAHLLKLDCSKAKNLLGWQSVWDSETTFRKTVQWYRSFHETGAVNSLADLQEFLA